MKGNVRSHNVLRTFVFWFILVTGIIGIPILIPLKKHYSDGALKTSRLKGNYIVICNHREWIDIPILCLIYFRTNLKFLATKKIFASSFSSRFMTAMGAIPIDKNHVDFTPINQLISLLKSGNTCVIFPEGGLSKDGEIAKFKDGVSMTAALSQAAVVPHYKTKYKAFHKTHIAIGRPIYYSDYFKTYSAANVLAFTSLLENEVKQLKTQLDEELCQKESTSIKQ